MRLQKIFLSLLCFSHTVSACPFEMVGFYPDWALEKHFSPIEIDWGAVNTVNHTPLRVDASANLIYSSAFKADISPLVSNAHLHGRQVLATLAVGSDCDGKHLQRILENSARRSLLVAHLAQFVKDHRYDGVTINWESPGNLFSAEGCSVLEWGNAEKCESDRRNLIVFSQELKSSLLLINSQARMHLVLPGQGVSSPCYRGEELAAIYDRLEIMTYDMYGPWSGFVGHNSQLYKPKNDPYLGVLSSHDWVQYWLQNQKIPAEKVLMGLPLYGYGFFGANVELHGSTQGLLIKAMGFQEIQQVFQTGEWDLRRDQEAGDMPYLVKKSGEGVISVEDALSVHRKAEYIRTHQLAGLMAFELTTDRNIQWNARLSTIAKNSLCR